MPWRLPVRLPMSPSHAPPLVGHQDEYRGSLAEPPGLGGVEQEAPLLSLWRIPLITFPGPSQIH